MIRFTLYAVRWQLSTPVLAVVMMLLGAGFAQAAVANLIGAGMFFWFDRWLFRKGTPLKGVT